MNAKKIAIESHHVHPSKTEERIKAYARKKCNVQRDICSFVGWHLVHDEDYKKELPEIADKLRNASEPVMD